MNSWIQRKEEVLKLAANKALQLPILESGLWFHGDVRDNFYYATHLFAAINNANIELPVEDKTAEALAERILIQVLGLQNQQPGSELYGHWPLNLHPLPEKAKLNTLPVELMGSLILFFYQQYQSVLSLELKSELNLALIHVYQSDFYRRKPERFNHHEAKYLAAQLLLGQQFDDMELLQEGHRNLQLLVDHVKKHGMREYGSLPWFWHWVQAFTCAWELIEDRSIKDLLGELLSYLWHERAQFYLKGTWVGAHSRVLPHDIPTDHNNLLDYIQFGDFPMPQSISRLEAAGLLSYEVPDEIRNLAIHRPAPREVFKQVPEDPELQVEGRLHNYAYITQNYAVGGMWEYVHEYQNEQHRWDITLPFQDSSQANQAFFYHPGPRHSEGDDRHPSTYSEVLFQQNIVAALYPLPAESEGLIKGCLPLGEWLTLERMLFGRVANVYIAVFLMQDYTVEEKPGRLAITSLGSRNGVLLEVVDTMEAQRLGIEDLQQFARLLQSRRPIYSECPLSIEYTSLSGNEIKLQVEANSAVKRSVNKESIDFNNYEV